MESQQLAGHWVLPTLESTGDGVVRMHVSIAVPDVDAIAGQPVELDVVAGGEHLPLREGPAPGAYYHLETITVTAVADFVFDNPGGQAPQHVTVTFGGEQATWPLAPEPPEPDLPVA